VAPAAGALEPIELGARGVAWLLDAFPDTDAVFCASDVVALGALCEAGRRDLEVPERLAIAGLGDFDFAGPSGLGLTTVRVPGRTIGIEAGRMLIERRSAGRPTGPAVVDVGFELVRRVTA
jgi:LacI family transcriptional regulator, gluconate utilization system Gnt-I transcriptional repressor